MWWLDGFIRQIEALWSLLERNQMVSGSFAMALAGLLWSISFRLYHRLAAWLSSTLMVKYDFAPGSAPNFALHHWLATRPTALAASSHRLVTVCTGEGKGSSKPRYEFVPELRSDVVMLYAGRLLWIYEQRPRGGAGDAGWGGGGMGSSGAGWVSTPGSWFQQMQYPRPYDAGGGAGTGGGAGSKGLTVCVMGWRTEEVIWKILEEGCAAPRGGAAKRTQMFRVSPAYRGGRGQAAWVDGGSRPSRPLSSVVLDGSEAGDILRDCEDFLASERWYAERGVPFRRGYLLHGLAGTGKTSLVQALAGELGVPIYMLRLSADGLDDDSLHALFASTAPRSIVLIEDVDSATAVVRRGHQGRGAGGAGGWGGRGGAGVALGGEAGGGVTLAGLLNAIDGVAAQVPQILNPKPYR